MDLSLEQAVKVARVAQTAGISSTFYIAPRSPFYNVFADDNQRAVWDIHNLGHRIGVHAWDEVWMTDFRLMERPFRQAVERFRPLVSFHMPDENVLWQPFSNCESAYAPQWEGRYRSDSRGVLPDLSDVGDGEGWQINLHPEWWDL